MAGHSSGWTKVKQGGVKRAVFISRDAMRRAGVTPRQIGQLSDEQKLQLASRSAQPVSQARTGDGLQGTVAVRMSNGTIQVPGEQRGRLQVHRDPKGGDGYVVSYDGIMVGTAGSVEQARRAADALNDVDFGDNDTIRERVNEVIDRGDLETSGERRRRMLDEQSVRVEREANTRERMARKARRDPQAVALNREFKDLDKRDRERRRRHQKEETKLREAQVRARAEDYEDQERGRTLAQQRQQIVREATRLEGLVEEASANTEYRVNQARRYLEQGRFDRSTYARQVEEAQQQVQSLRGSGDRRAQRAARERLEYAREVLAEYDRRDQAGEVARLRQEADDLISGRYAERNQERMAELGRQAADLWRQADGLERELREIAARREARQRDITERATEQRERHQRESKEFADRLMDTGQRYRQLVRDITERLIRSRPGGGSR